MVLMDLIKLLDMEENKRRRNKETNRFFLRTRVGSEVVLW
jgi:hypothetical protein